MVGGGDAFTNSDRGVADADLWTPAVVTELDFDSGVAEDFSIASRSTAANVGADLDNVSGLSGPSVS